MAIQRFEDLDAWKRAKDLSVAVYRATARGTFAADFGLRDQIRRASVSVMSNVAEGFGRYGRAEFRRFLVMARGSAAEVRSQAILAHELGCLTRDEFDHLVALASDVSSILVRLHASLWR